YHDVLQIADIVVGVVRYWVEKVSKDEPLPPRFKKNLVALTKRFRRGHVPDSIFGDGLIIHPPEWDLWPKLKESIRDN
ncbi:MAG: hypothetical protein ACPLPS_08835, partial [bacterium]